MLDGLFEGVSFRRITFPGLNQIPDLSRFIDDSCFSFGKVCVCMYICLRCKFEINRHPDFGEHLAPWYSDRMVLQ